MGAAIKLLFLALLFASATAQASYFVDAPSASIEPFMQGCLAEQKCAAQATRLIPPFAKSKSMTEAEVREKLEHCETPDRNMGLCVMYEVFALDDELQGIVQVRLQKNPGDKLALPLRNVALWSQRKGQECYHQVEKDKPDARGIYLSELIVSCQVHQVRATVKRLRSRKS